MIQRTIKEVAESLIGLKEKPGNSGVYAFPNEFQETINRLIGYAVVRSTEDIFKSLGWKRGESWCAYFAKLVWIMAYSAYDSTFINDLDRLFEGGAAATRANFIKAGWVHTYTPSVGALAF